jgi:hypothetical protein
MDAFKFACPVCGQHISCGPDKAGSHMECPTCFQMLVVPQPPKGEQSKLILTAAKVQTRPIPKVEFESTVRPAKKSFPVAPIVFVVVLGAAVAAGVVFRDRIFSRGSTPDSGDERAKIPASQAPAVVTPATPDANWILDLAKAKIPEDVAAGRVNGRDFHCERAVIKGGQLDLRQGDKWPPDAGLTIYLPASNTEDLAGRTIHIAADTAKPPDVKLRWKNEQGEADTKTIHAGYALWLEFGQLRGKRMSGKIYLCTPDDNHSWVAGTFEAEIRKPKPQ